MNNTIFFKVLSSILAILFTGCSPESEKEEITHIDVSSSDYPQKTIELSEIADISYVRFEHSDEALFSGHVVEATDETIVIYSPSTKDFFFFDPEGKLKSKFNRYGNGPEEYNFVSTVCYDARTDELFVPDRRKKKMFVYSSQGDCKRIFTLPANASINFIADFDDHSLLLYDHAKREFFNYHVQFAMQEEQPQGMGEIYPSSYCLISKTNGDVLENIPMPENFELVLGVPPGDDAPPGLRMLLGRTSRIVPYRSGFLLNNQETDTLFYLREDHSLTPAFVRTPPVKEMGTVTYLNALFEAGAYDFIQTMTLIKVLPGPLKTDYYIRERTSGDMYRPQVVFADYKTDFVLEPGIVTTSKNAQTGVLMYDVGTLKTALQENRLAGKLKEIVADMGEDENDLLFLLKFKSR